jgi:hypothetical protein
MQEFALLFFLERTVANNGRYNKIIVGENNHFSAELLF